MLQGVYRCSLKSGRWAFGAVAASMVAYLVAQLVDVHVFHFWKKLTRGKHLWLRNNGSTVVSQLVDTTAVILITHYFARALPINPDSPIVRQLLVFIATGYVFKLVMAMFDTIPFMIGDSVFSPISQAHPARPGCNELRTLAFPSNPDRRRVAFMPMNSIPKVQALRVFSSNCWSSPIMSKPLILLADDEPHITHIIAHKLKRADMEVIVVEDGEMALKAAIEHKPDAIVTDLQMPYLSGIEFAKQLSQNNECSQIPIILLTARGYAVEDEVKDIPSVRKLLSKPFSAKELLGHIHETARRGQFKGRMRMNLRRSSTQSDMIPSDLIDRCNELGLACWRLDLNGMPTDDPIAPSMLGLFLSSSPIRMLIIKAAMIWSTLDTFEPQEIHPGLWVLPYLEHHRDRRTGYFVAIGFGPAILESNHIEEGCSGNQLQISALRHVLKERAVVDAGQARKIHTILSWMLEDLQTLQKNSSTIELFSEQLGDSYEVVTTLEDLGKSMGSLNEPESIIIDGITEIASTLDYNWVACLINHESPIAQIIGTEIFQAGTTQLAGLRD